MPPRFHVPLPLRRGDQLDLPPGPARHAQVLRLQPGDLLTLFNGEGGEWAAEVLLMSRKDVRVHVGEHHAVDRELAQRVTLALGMPANERMDTLVEKASELGVAVIQPLLCERSVLRLSGERADKKVAHWRGVAVAASEQCGRTRVAEVAAVMSLVDWLRALPDADAAVTAAASASASALLSASHPPPPGAAGLRCLLSPRATRAWQPSGIAGPLLFLSGPEGGLSEAEEALAVARGFTAVSLGPRVLRADTAPLAVLASLAVAAGLDSSLSH